MTRPTAAHTTGISVNAGAFGNRISNRCAVYYQASIEGIPYAALTEAGPGDPNQAYIRSLDEAAQVAYGDALQGDIQNRIEVAVLGNNAGIPRDGCVSDARTALYGSLEGALVSVILTQTRAGSTFLGACPRYCRW